MAEPEPESSRSMLLIEDVTKRYGKFTALEHVSFEVKRGTHLLILGPNGAGKTTMIKCILSLASFRGRITVDGLETRRDSTKVKKLIGYVPQNYAFYENLTVREQARMSSRLKGVDGAQVQEKLEKVDLWYAKDKKIRALSDGMRQRLGIALALIGDPPILILDEPTSNIDLRGQLEFQDLLLRLLKEGKTMITSTHLTGLGELASEVLVLDHGIRVAYGEPASLLKQAKVADTLYLHVDGSRSEEITKMLQDSTGNEVVVKGNWLTTSVAGEDKMKVLKGLINSGINVDDLMIERTSIESEYLKLLGGERA